MRSEIVYHVEPDYLTRARSSRDDWSGIMIKFGRAGILAGVALLLAHPFVKADAKSEADANWPAWRGPLGNGVAPKAKPPTEWSEDHNIRWKVEIPGKGHATPIVWGDRIYIQTAVETNREPKDADAGNGGSNSMESMIIESSAGAIFQPGDGRGGRGGRLRPDGRRGFGGGDAPKHMFEFQVIALDRNTGKTIWTKTVREERPHESGHSDATQASNSPVTDGKHIYAYFGSRGLYCLDMDGNVKWEKQFGRMQTRNQFGEGSSPVMHGDTIVVVWDHEGEDFIVALNKKNGKERWRKERDEPTSWCTPVVVEVKGRAQVVACSTNHVRAYDLKTGDEVWRCTGMTQNTIPTPLVAGDLLYAISGFRGAAAMAIRYAAAKGDITDKDAIVWRYDQDTPYVPTGVIYNNRLYFVENNRPILTCLDGKSGKPVYDKVRLTGPDSIYASFAAADGKVYISGRNGTTVVLKDGSAFEVLATNTLDDGFDASPVLVGDSIYLRGRSHLYCIAESK